jgi:hypothetical protein
VRNLREPLRSGKAKNKKRDTKKKPEKKKQKQKTAKASGDHARLDSSPAGKVGLDKHETWISHEGMKKKKK